MDLGGQTRTHAVDVGRAALRLDGQLVVVRHARHQGITRRHHAARRDRFQVDDAAAHRGQDVTALQYVLGGAHLLLQVGDLVLRVAPIGRHPLSAPILQVDDLQP